MNLIDSLTEPMYMGRILVSAMLSVLFLQSGLDKIFDRKGNLSWLQDHFSGSLFGGMVPVLLSVITFFEVAAGALSGTGMVLFLLSGHLLIGRLGAVLAGLSILMLFTGQRIAKDYAGAASLVPYFLLALAGIFLFGQ